MKRKISYSIIAVVTASFALSIAGTAQSYDPRPYSLGIYAGGSLPMGDFKTQAETGYHVGVFGSTALATRASVRLDGVYTDFGKKDVTFTDGVATYGTKMLQGTLDAQYDFNAQTEMAGGGGAIPYVSAGAGFYRFNFDDACTGAGCAGLNFGKNSETHWGLNVGAGAVFFLSGFSPFVDIHYHSITPKNDQQVRANILALSFGLKL